MNPKNLDTKEIALIILKLEQNRFTTDEFKKFEHQRNCINYPKIRTKSFYTVCPYLSVRKLRNITVNSVGPDQTAPTGAV